MTTQRSVRARAPRYLRQGGAPHSVALSGLVAAYDAGSDRGEKSSTMLKVRR
jgi:hypothetical protein